MPIEWYLEPTVFATTFRETWIGVPRFYRSTTLPNNHCWANGDFVSFDDWPELKGAYEAGKFEGMLLDYNADDSTKSANLGKWRPDAATPTGLYAPNLSGRYFKLYASSDDEVGSTLAAGLPSLNSNMTGSANFYGATPHDASGIFYYDSVGGGWNSADWNGCADVSVTINLSDNSLYGNSSSVTPASIGVPVVIYLGKASY